MVRVQSISPRPKLNNFSRATVPLTGNGEWLSWSVFFKCFLVMSTDIYVKKLSAESLLYEAC